MVDAERGADVRALVREESADGCVALHERPGPEVIGVAGKSDGREHDAQGGHRDTDGGPELAPPRGPRDHPLRDRSS